MTLTSKMRALFQKARTVGSVESKTALSTTIKAPRTVVHVPTASARLCVLRRIATPSAVFVKPATSVVHARRHLRQLWSSRQQNDVALGQSYNVVATVAARWCACGGPAIAMAAKYTVAG
eukprot:575902-Amphidinium_carterae.1